MNLYEAVKSNTKKYNLIHADSDKISELEKGSAFTWDGLNSDDNSLSQVVDFFTKESKGFKVPCDMYWWSGKEFNDKYELTGSNKYPDNLTFVSIPLDMWSEMGNLPMLKFQVGARWLDDIVDNNARREGKEDLDESDNGTKYFFLTNYENDKDRNGEEVVIKNYLGSGDYDIEFLSDGKILKGVYPTDVQRINYTVDDSGKLRMFTQYRDNYRMKLFSKYRKKIGDYLKNSINSTRGLSEAERVSEIDLKRISLEDREYDLNFSDKLEELGYEYIFKYDGKVFYRRDPNHFDDDIIVIDTEHGVMTKVDHNGESLFFNDDEVSKLNQEEE